MCCYNRCLIQLRCLRPRIDYDQSSFFDAAKVFFRNNHTSFSKVVVGGEPMGNDRPLGPLVDIPLFEKPK